MQLPRSIDRLPTGLSFEIPDLIMLQAWADFHDLRMMIDLDVCVEGEQYEEVLALCDRKRKFRRWGMWRSPEGIMVQPTMGRTMLFDRMADVLDMLIPACD